MQTLAERRWLFEKINNKTDQVIRNKVIYKYKKWKKGITIFHGNTKIFMSKKYAWNGNKKLFRNPRCSNLHIKIQNLIPVKITFKTRKLKFHYKNK